MSKKSPFQVASAEHGGKEALLDKVVGVLERADESKDEMKARLKGAANAKLLRLLAIGMAVKERFGSKAQLVDALLALEQRVKDQDYRAKLLAWSPSKLLDRHDATARRKKREAA